MHVVGANYGRASEDWRLEARETGLIEEIRLENAVCNPQRSASVFDLILYDKCRKEKNIHLLLNTRVVGAEVGEGVLRCVRAVRDSTEDSFTIEAKVFIDATGDGGLGVAAGADYVHGREGQATYGERLAAAEADGKTLGSTLLFMARKHEEPVPFVAPEWARCFRKEDFRNRATFLSDQQHHYEYGYWWIEWGGELDTIKDNEAIRDELLAIVMGVWDYIKNAGEHGASHWALDWFGVLPGKRESRRFLGQHVLCERDLMEARPFADGIAYGGWPIDLHPVGGIDDRDALPCVQTPVPYLYEIPLRACVSRNVANLMFAGRNISASHIAFASTRVMATCALIGEGVGVAAAHASRNGMLPSALAEDVVAMGQIRQRLLREDVFLIGVREEPEGDIARSAAITASSEQEEGAALQVISGQNRCVEGPNGVHPSQLCPGAHRWMSAPGFPAWLELRWPEPVPIRQVELTFDTGLHRHLTLTHSDNYLKRMLWGVPQPETVRDFTLCVEQATGWEPVREVRDHWQRRATLLFETPLTTQALRIRVEKTWGCDHARIVRVAIF